MMKLYLVRHGKAARPDPDHPRSLTPKGKEEVKLIAGHFKKNHLHFKTLWHSPKTRAAQTAEIVLKVAGNPRVKVEEKKELKPEGDARQVYDEINRDPSESLVVVTHLPFIAELASLLAADSPDASLTFPTAGVAAFEKKGGNWKWLWSLDPHSLG